MRLRASSSSHRRAEITGRASLEGWRDYFRNPAPANKLIQIDNPKETDGQIAFAIDKMKEMRVLDRGEAAKSGIGTMTDARWKATRDFLVDAKLLSPAVDYRKAFTTRFTDVWTAIGTTRDILTQHLAVVEHG